MLRALLLLAVAVAFRHQGVQEVQVAVRRKARYSASTLFGLIQARRSHPSSMAESACASTFQETGTVLGEGEHGRVSQVRKAGTAWGSGLGLGWLGLGGEYYAMKEVREDLDPDEHELGEMAAEKEVEIMAAAKAHHCAHVMPLIEESPCIAGVRKEHAIVTELMPWDFEKWRREYEIPEGCYQKVFDTIDSGLSCMHASGYAHLDLKTDNVLFKDFDEEGCPSGMKLADFGLSEPLGDLVQKFPKADYAAVNHNPPSMFNGMPDPFKITTKAKGSEGKSRMHFRVVPELDECSFALMMYELFEKHDASLQQKLGEGKCGMMGYYRNVTMP